MAESASCSRSTMLEETQGHFVRELNLRGAVSKPYRQPFPHPIRVRAGERVSADFGKVTDLPGWVWCTDDRGRSGWTPQEWLDKQGTRWRIIRDFDAIELTVEVRMSVTVHLEVAGFYRLTVEDGCTGWVPTDHVRLDD